MTRQQFSENTLIPVSLLITIGGAAVGFIIWLTTVANAVASQGNEVREMRAALQELAAIRQDISEIKGELKRIKR